MAQDGNQAWTMFCARRYGLVVTDLRLPGISGISLIERVHARAPALPIVVTTAFATIESTVEALRCGAADYLPKPFDPHHLKTVIARTLAIRADPAEPDAGKPLDAPTGMFVGRSRLMCEAIEMADRVADSNAQVLIRGETGVGKELLARRIHARSPRRHGPFVRFNCGNLAPGLADAQLFGSERGAYTSSVRDARGVLEDANEGTLFLDEIGELDQNLQVRLLDFIQDRSFRRLGSSTLRRSNARLLLATHRDLERGIAQSTFRTDLYYRIRQVQLTLPALRHRREDIPDLARFLLRHHHPQMELGPGASSLIMDHAWPGNVRELEQALIAAAAMSSEPIISRAMLSRAMGLDAACHETRVFASDEPPSPEATLAEVERWHLMRALKHHDGNVSATSRALGIDRSTIQRKIRRSR